MAARRHDIGDFLVFLRKVRETPCYPWEPFTHQGRVAHNARWYAQRGEKVRAEAARRGIRIPPTWSDVDAAGMYPVLCTGIYEVPGFEPRGTVVDVGAGYGDYAVLTARLPGVTEVVGLEPTAHSLSRAREFAELNAVHVRLIHAAGGAKSGSLRLGSAGTHAMSVLSVEDAQEVAVVAVDDLPVPRIDFLKIDVEGAEGEVLRGAERTLSEMKPRIAIEVHSRALAEGVDRFLSGFGYVLLHHDHGVRASYPMDLVQNRFYGAGAPSPPSQVG